MGNINSGTGGSSSSGGGVGSRGGTPYVPHPAPTGQGSRGGVAYVPHPAPVGPGSRGGQPKPVGGSGTKSAAAKSPIASVVKPQAQPAQSAQPAGTYKNQAGKTVTVNTPADRAAAAQAKAATVQAIKTAKQQGATTKTSTSDAMAAAKASKDTAGQEAIKQQIGTAKVSGANTVASIKKQAAVTAKAAADKATAGTSDQVSQNQINNQHDKVAATKTSINDINAKIKAIKAPKGSSKAVRAKVKAQSADLRIQKKNLETTAKTQTGALKDMKTSKSSMVKTEKAATAAGKQSVAAEDTANKAQAAEMNREAAAKAADAKKAGAQANKEAKQSAAAAKKQAAVQAKAQKAKDNIQIKQSKAALAKTATLAKQAAALLTKTTNAAAKARIKAAIGTLKATHAAHTAKLSKIKEPKGKHGSVTSGHKLADITDRWDMAGPYKFVIWRELSLQEKRVDWIALNETYDQRQSQLKTALTVAIGAMIAAGLISMRNRLKAGDVAGIGNLTIISPNKLNAVINPHIKSAYEIGKATAAKEMKVPKPVTPTKKTQLMNLDSSMISEQIATNIDLAAKQKARDGFAKGVAETAIVAAAAAAAYTAAGRMISHAVGNIDGENINKGRSLVFDTNIDQIQGFLRSEILDDRTCNFCEELDQQTVTADDPMADLDEVHDNCRGTWVPILSGEDFNAADAGLPATLENSFDTIGGSPTVNSFTQLSKPLDESGQATADEVANDLGDSGDE